jgi:hypothetical protein
MLSEGGINHKLNRQTGDERRLNAIPSKLDRRTRRLLRLGKPRSEHRPVNARIRVRHEAE